MVSKIYEKVKHAIAAYRVEAVSRGGYMRDILMAVCVCLVGIIGFGLGRLSVVVPRDMPLRIVGAAPAHYETKSDLSPDVSPPKKGGATGPIVASKNGTTYYFTTCANRISEANKIFFDTEADAQKAGYRLAKNCAQ